MERRNLNDRNNATALDDKQKDKRRNYKRREHFRLVYPPSVEPKILNTDFHIMDISQHGIQFFCSENCMNCTHPISLKSILDLEIQFHDGETINVKVEILRCERTLFSREKTYTGFIQHGITTERIAKEQSYLLSHFPDYCRFTQEWIP